MLDHDDTREGDAGKGDPKEGSTIIRNARRGSSCKKRARRECSTSKNAKKKFETIRDAEVVLSGEKRARKEDSMIRKGATKYSSSDKRWHKNAIKKTDCR